MTVSSREQAWIEAGKIFPTDYDKDESSSARAGYPIFRFRGDWCTGDFANNWISDLGNRLEVNLASGESINIWIEKEKPEFGEYQLADALKIISENQVVLKRALVQGEKQVSFVDLLVNDPPQVSDHDEQ